jgi:Flp pilus assembly protein TadG
MMFWSGPKRGSRFQFGTGAASDSDPCPIEARGCEGAALVEFALSCFILITLLFGIIEMCLGMYSYNFVADAAREASRWAIVRGSECSTNTPLQTNCDASSATIQTYVRSLNYPGAANLNVSASWLKATVSGTPPTTTWSNCVAGTCNAPGNMVKVVVTYVFPIGVPFWKATTVSLSSTSTMVISQ